MTRDIPTLQRRRGIFGQPRPPDLARYQAAILDLSPTFHLPTTEGSGTALADATGNGHPGTLNPTTGPFWASGPVNQTWALKYEAGSESAEVADAAVFDATSIAAAGWVQIDSGSTFIARGSNPDSFSLRTFILSLDSLDNIEIRRFSGSNSTIYELPTGITIRDGNWHWFAWKYTSSAFTAACDGVDLGSTATSGNLNSSNKHIQLGAVQDLGGVISVLDGKLAQISFWAAPTITIADLIACYEAIFI